MASKTVYGECDGGSCDNPDYAPGDCGDLGSAWSGCWNEEYRKHMVAVVRPKMEYLYNQYGDHAVAFPLFPWACIQDDTTTNDNLLTWPTVSLTDWKCWADNEVADLGFPPYVNFYYGYFTEDYKLYLSVAKFGPDGYVDTPYEDKLFEPVMDDGDDRVW